MRALILNSGQGTRLGEITKNHPKCMTEIFKDETIIGRQLRQLAAAGIKDVVITTGPFSSNLELHCKNMNLGINFKFIPNPKYQLTNYIYSIFLARNELDDDILLLHGDLVFSDKVLNEIVGFPGSCMAISSTVPLPEKDFKAVIDGRNIKKIGIEFFDNAVTAQPMYKILKKDWAKWQDKIIEYCNQGKINCYAENAFNDISASCNLIGMDIKEELCNEIDNIEDLKKIKERISHE